MGSPARGATLTAAGEALVGPARQVLRDFGTAYAAVQHVAGLTAGHLDIVSLTTLAMADDASRYGARVHATDPPLVQHVRLVWRGGALSPAVAALLDLARELDLVAEDPSRSHRSIDLVPIRH